MTVSELKRQLEDLEALGLSAASVYYDGDAGASPVNSVSIYPGADIVLSDWEGKT